MWFIISDLLEWIYATGQQCSRTHPVILAPWSSLKLFCAYRLHLGEKRYQTQKNGGQPISPNANIVLRRSIGSIRYQSQGHKTEHLHPRAQTKLTISSVYYKPTLDKWMHMRIKWKKHTNWKQKFRMGLRI